MNQVVLHYLHIFGEIKSILAMRLTCKWMRNLIDNGNMLNVVYTRGSQDFIKKCKLNKVVVPLFSDFPKEYKPNTKEITFIGEDKGSIMEIQEYVKEKGIKNASVLLKMKYNESYYFLDTLMLGSMTNVSCEGLVFGSIKECVSEYITSIHIDTLMLHNNEIIDLGACINLPRIKKLSIGNLSSQKRMMTIPHTTTLEELTIKYIMPGLGGDTCYFAFFIHKSLKNFAIHNSHMGIVIICNKMVIENVSMGNCKKYDIYPGSHMRVKNFYILGNPEDKKFSSAYRSRWCISKAYYEMDENTLNSGSEYTFLIDEIIYYLKRGTKINKALKYCHERQSIKQELRIFPFSRIGEKVGDYDLSQPYIGVHFWKGEVIIVDNSSYFTNSKIRSDMERVRSEVELYIKTRLQNKKIRVV